MAISVSQVEVKKGLDEVYVKKTKLSWIDGQNGRLYYRGYRIEDLAKYSTFEEITFLLWYGRLPKRDELSKFKSTLVSFRWIPDELINLMKKVPKNAHPMDILKIGISAAATYDPELEDMSSTANIRKAMRILAKAPTIVAAWHRIRNNQDPIEPTNNLDHAANFLYMLNEEKPDELSSRIMDVALILHAEHGMNASTFTALVTASTLSDIYSAVVSGISALKGPLHGGANERALRMIMEVGSPDRAESYVLKKLARKERIMGFGHRVYKAYDPRARILKEYARMLCEKKKDMKLYETAVKIEEVVLRELSGKRIFTNVDFFSGIVYYHLGIPPDLFTTIFAMARIVGWTAHILEYWSENRIIRPRALYVGELDKQYLPMEERCMAPEEKLELLSKSK